MSMPLRSRIRRWIAAALFYSGLLRLLATLRLRGKAVVLMYHRVLPQAEQARSFSSAGMFVTPETFERHVRYLRGRLNPVTLERFIALLEAGRPFPPGTCLVTFDDGWRDNLEQALPILERNGVPATIFITTGVVGHAGGFWQEHLQGMLYRAWQEGAFDASLRAELGAGDLDLAIDDVDQVRAALRGLVTALKEKSPREIREVIERVAGHLRARGIEHARGDADGLMSWNEIRKLHESGVITIGSHCETHTPMTRLPRPAVHEELDDSRRQLETQLGVPVVALAFPNGDHDSTACDEARACGYRIAFTTRPGAVAAGDDPLRLRRVSIHEGAAATIPLLMCRAMGIL